MVLDWLARGLRQAGPAVAQKRTRELTVVCRLAILSTGGKRAGLGRAAAFAVNILAIHTLGDVISPPMIGAIADRTSLTHGFVAVSAFMAIGGVLSDS